MPKDIGLSKGVSISFGGTRGRKKPKITTQHTNRTLQKIWSDQRKAACEIAGSFYISYLFLTLLKAYLSPELYRTTTYIICRPASADRWRQPWRYFYASWWWRWWLGRQGESWALHVATWRGGVSSEPCRRGSYSAWDIWWYKPWVRLNTFLKKMIVLKKQCRKRIDSCTRKDRVKLQVEAWKRQTPLLAKAYLHWKDHGKPVEKSPSEQSWDMCVMSFTCTYHIF